MSYLRSGSYFLRIENLSDVPLYMNQFAGRWYDLQNKEMLTEEQSLKNGAAVLVPYLDFFFRTSVCPGRGKEEDFL